MASIFVRVTGSEDSDTDMGSLDTPPAIIAPPSDVLALPAPHTVAPSAVDEPEDVIVNVVDCSQRPPLPCTVPPRAATPTVPPT